MTCTVTYEEAKFSVMAMGPKPGQTWLCLSLAGTPTCHILKVRDATIWYRIHGSAEVRQFPLLQWLVSEREQGTKQWT